MAYQTMGVFTLWVEIPQRWAVQFNDLLCLGQNCFLVADQKDGGGELLQPLQNAQRPGKVYSGEGFVQKIESGRWLKDP